MTTRVGLISDPHATAAPVAEALARLEGAGADLVLCAGDIAGYGDELEATAALLAAASCRAILGNHDADLLAGRAGPQAGAAREFLAGLPRRLELELEGVRLCMVHAEPPDALEGGIRLLDADGMVLGEQRAAWARRLAGLGQDVLVVGHTHQVFAEWLGATLVVNPGSTRFNHACALLSLPGLEVEFLGLSGRAPLRAWHWGLERRGEGPRRGRAGRPAARGGGRAP